MNRVGGPQNSLLGDNAGLSTQIGRMKGDNGPGSSNLAKYNDRIANDPNQVAIIKAFKDIQNFCSRLNLKQNVEDIACELFKQLHDSKELKGRNRAIVVTTCIYWACKNENCPRTLKELCAQFSIRKRDVGRCYLRVMKLKKAGKIKITIKRRAADPRTSESEKYMIRFGSALKLPPSVINMCTKVAGTVSKLGVCAGKTPAAVAAASILLVTQLGCHVKPQYYREPVAIADAAYVKVGTVKAAYSKLFKVRGRLFTKDDLDQKDGFITSSAIQNLSPLTDGPAMGSSSSSSSSVYDQQQRATTEAVPARGYGSQRVASRQMHAAPPPPPQQYQQYQQYQVYGQQQQQQQRQYQY
eukprot:TRINITY_DN349_c0_g2_i1.p1 TRINITY_DN349_c0_g2~~TRINITY_DN349_c0_g2_i1.p1  ORF type:complete len:355 (-),score=80.64 TRINITY_DN349_c0_g2_i1:107-1171(-)